MDKVDSPQAQRRTLEAALAGEKWQPAPDGLTSTEREILAYYAAGRSGEDTGGSTYRAPSTV